ncbi:toprim domain-containing protein [Methanothermobacter tenebrarum]|uniref:Topoisomerase n=1 Tax=Methanothermobacter tenebrarum TaxID=680118 RepID=A0A328PFI9_9EURY|nr:toprim domain-containing protein [Methanothermobacter tenebrarum]NPV64809.1 topoisomerase [Methanobacteriaceae archaeon]RAO78585.1 topoisomerase [Methanothermobacter tenebrarum]
MLDNRGPIDVRIIVEGASDVESVSKALQDVSLGSEYHITISSIIPTTSLEIAKRAVEGADIVLIATDADATGRELAEKFQKSLKGNVGHVERVKLPYGHDVEYIDPRLMMEEIKNAIIRAGLSSIANIRKLRKLEEKVLQFKSEIDELANENSTLKDENNRLSNELEKIIEEKEELNSKLEELEEKFTNLQEDYRKIKEKYKELKSKSFLEMFPLHELWKDLFDEELEDEEKIVKVADTLKSENLIIGQGHIAAPSKEDAIACLRTIRTILFLMSRTEE